jgi:hypothetical protein
MDGSSGNEQSRSDFLSVQYYFHVTGSCIVVSDPTIQNFKFVYPQNSYFKNAVDLLCLYIVCTMYTVQ